jgi:hypothetical protein
VKVSIDGGETYQEVESVRIIYENVDVAGEDDPSGEVHINHTGEGIITDVWVSRESSLDHNIATEAASLEDIVDRLLDQDA